MRMKEKGISTVLLVVIPIIIVVAVVVPVVVIVAVGGGGAGGIPVYSGASELTSQTQGNTTSTMYDLGTANLADVYNWYKTEMPKQGWAVTDASTSYAYVLNCTKGNDSATITIVAGTLQGYSANRLLEISYTAGTPSETPGGGQPC